MTSYSKLPQPKFSKPAGRQSILVNLFCNIVIMAKSFSLQYGMLRKKGGG